MSPEVLQLLGVLIAALVGTGGYLVNRRGNSVAAASDAVALVRSEMEKMEERLKSVEKDNALLRTENQVLRQELAIANARIAALEGRDPDEVGVDFYTPPDSSDVHLWGVPLPRRVVLALVSMLGVGFCLVLLAAIVVIFRVT